jgi:hypothetical protein
MKNKLNVIMIDMKMSRHPLSVISLRLRNTGKLPEETKVEHLPVNLPL